MSTLEQYYDQNPISVIDQNRWDVRHPQVAMKFKTMSVYTPLIDWTDEPARTGASTIIETELLEGDVNTDEIATTANYIDATAVDSRFRKYSTGRHADKVQLNETSNIFQQWQLSGGDSASRDWKPILRGVLGNNIVRKHERLARNAFLKGPKAFWTYSGAVANIAALDGTKVFGLDIVNEWNLRMGSTGSPVIAGDVANAKVAIIPPGSQFDFLKSLGAASASEASMWRDSHLYAGERINYEIGSYKGVRFVVAPNDKFGLNPAVLYNTGVIAYQYGVTERINAGDGAPDPDLTAVDETFYVGQRGAAHKIQLENFSASQFFVGDIVTIHTKRSNVYGVVNGVDPVADGMAVERRIVAVDPTLNTLSFDRPLMRNYHVGQVGTSQSGALGTYYAFVTKAKHIGFVLTLGARGGVLGAVARPLQFKEPKPVDDFESVWRFTWDSWHGYNVWEPNLFECHFVNVSLPKIGGIIAP